MFVEQGTLPICLFVFLNGVMVEKRRNNLSAFDITVMMSEKIRSHVRWHAIKINLFFIQVSVSSANYYM